MDVTSALFSLLCIVSQICLLLTPVLVVGLIIIFLVHKNAKKYTRQRDIVSWPTVEGNVVKIQTVNVTEAADTDFYEDIYILVVYSVNGVPYNKKIKWAGPVNMDARHRYKPLEGRQVILRYNPRNPNDVVVEKMLGDSIFM